MSEFVDVSGASGAAYRFRRTTPAELPAMAGNLLIATGGAGRLKVLFCGSARNLAGAAPRVAQTLKASRRAKLFVRLNVVRAARDAEHADIVAGVAPASEDADID